MLLTLEACPHVTVTQYTKTQGTCMSCYQRLRRSTLSGKRPVWQRDTPVGMCNHALKTPIPDMYTRQPKFRDAMCSRCGSVLRHPDGPGSWEEVIFNGFLIREELNASDLCSVSIRTPPPDF